MSEKLPSNIPSSSSEFEGSQPLSEQARALREHARRVQEARSPYRSMSERLDAVREVERFTGQVILVDEDRETFITDLAAQIARTSPPLVREIRALRAGFDQDRSIQRRNELAEYLQSLNEPYAE